MSAAFIRGKKRSTSQSVTEVRNFTFSLQRFLLDPPPVVRRLFEVNSEPHTGARPSVRLCVELNISIRHAPVLKNELLRGRVRYCSVELR